MHRTASKKESKQSGATTMLPSILALILTLCFIPILLISGHHTPPIHYTISRRGGTFPPQSMSMAGNLTTYLLEQLQLVETRFHATTRGFEGNRVVRKPRRVKGTQAGTVLLGEVGREGNWFTTVGIGEPRQEINMDLDMLTADWWMFSGNTEKGSFFWDLNSKTFVDSEQPIAFPSCREPTDVIHLPTSGRSVSMSFALCRPAKQWLNSLLPSGLYLGLAPSNSLSQTKTASFMSQLVEKKIVDSPVWSIQLVNGKEGLFSIGGTSISEVRQVEMETEESMKHLWGHDEHKRNEKIEDGAGNAESILKYSDKDWKWTKIQGADGWWQILMHGIWIDGAKILQNQPVILDINTPFIIAPPLAARALYSSISGSRQLQHPYDQFYTYPCFNLPKVHFEFAGWIVEVLKGKRDAESSSPGSRFSLGRVAPGSGYCIGVIVESRMRMSSSHSGGMREAEEILDADAGNGLSDVWIIGETFFRDVQVAFDWKEKKVGMQRA